MFWTATLDPETELANCSHGNLRLVDGPTVREGRVEICLNNAWGTVCSQLFDNLDATVVCAQMDFEREGKPIISQGSS